MNIETSTSSEMKKAGFGCDCDCCKYWRRHVHRVASNEQRRSSRKKNYVKSLESDLKIVKDTLRTCWNNQAALADRNAKLYKENVDLQRKLIEERNNNLGFLGRLLNKLA